MRNRILKKGVVPMKKRLFSLLLSIILVIPFVSAVAAEDIAPFSVNCKSAVLMDAGSGKVLYSFNAEEALPPASVTKIMTLLLVFEAIDSGALSLSDTVTCSEYAASMGGSQVFLEPGENMTVDDMLKCVVISSANDAAVALAEKVCGSEELFVDMMNSRALELGMNNTHFENVTGLDDDVQNHTISAMDIAIASRELICKHPDIMNYTTVWMDTVRNGEFGLSNTNRLIRFYDGATGLKTGSTSKAGFCISATAKRGEMHLIAVIMGANTRDERNECAKMLLDWGFATYKYYSADRSEIKEIAVKGGIADKVPTETVGFSTLLGNGLEKKITTESEIPEYANAPVKKGDVVGRIIYKCDGEVIGEVSVKAAEDVREVRFLDVFVRILSGMCLG